MERRAPRQGDELVEVIARGRADLADLTRLVWERGYSIATGGNLSVRLPDGTMLITPSGITKRRITPEQVVRVTLDGELVEPSEWRPSSEFRIHSVTYRACPDVHAVVHAHPPAATACAVAGVALTEPVTPEFVAFLKEVPLVPYGRPGTRELPARLEPFLQGHVAALLANHGAIAFGRDLEEAFNRLELVERYALMLVMTRALGGARLLPEGEVRWLSGREKA